MHTSGDRRMTSFDIRSVTENNEEGVPLGFKIQDFDRAFRYGQAPSGGCTAGYLYCSNANAANHSNCAATAAAAIGSTEVTVQLGATAVTANEFEGGTLHPNDVAPEGIAGFRILSHPAADSAATLTLQLAEPFSEALTTSSELTLIHNKYKAVEATTTQTTPPAGIAVADMTASYYGWFQVEGPIGVLHSGTGTATLGQNVTISANDAGAVAVVDADTEILVGYMLDAGVSGEFNSVELKIG